MRVALYTSAWIEIVDRPNPLNIDVVALYTSAWIEIAFDIVIACYHFCRTLHECVD